ncbi:diacylglycerol kinase zeta-like isoform X2 [Brevipalpus obovatus]|uniref:diacylglycerol kinase zeta-like isoform X2 n=1 Tax=Brevipalpus obovatus TaxID=246614 RepID=UPI003D9F8E44
MTDNQHSNTSSSDQIFFASKSGQSQPSTSHSLSYAFSDINVKDDQSSPARSGGGVGSGGGGQIVTDVDNLPESFTNLQVESENSSQETSYQSFASDDLCEGSSSIPSQLFAVDVSSVRSPDTGRSKSFDAAVVARAAFSKVYRSSAALLDVPKWRLLIRKPISSPSPPCQVDLYLFKDCTHCNLIETYHNTHMSLPPSIAASISTSVYLNRYLSSHEETDDETNPKINDEESIIVKTTLVDEDLSENVDSGRTDSDHTDTDAGSNQSRDDSEGLSRNRSIECRTPPHRAEALPMICLSEPVIEADSTAELDYGSGITVVSLEVPIGSKSNRSTSVDSSFLQVPKRTDIELGELGPSKSQRSRSVDIALPEGPDGPYLVVPTMKEIQTTKKAIQGEIKISTVNGETRTLRSAPDWGETAINGDHLWISTSASGDLCYVGENECSKQGPRFCCPACKITAHTGCIGILIDKIKFHCKPTFKDVGVRQYREQTVIYHHWVHRRHQKGRCQHCGKSFQSKLSFGNKEIVAISCSWCKAAYHNKDGCFAMERLSEICNLGLHRDLIIPPSWIVKLPRKGSFKSSIRRSPKHQSSKRVSKKEISPPTLHHQAPSQAPLMTVDYFSATPSSPPPMAPLPTESTESTNSPSYPSTSTQLTEPRLSLASTHRSFAIKPIPSVDNKPLLIFLNPKSGGNQGSKLMQKFQWLLNPRQVFDMSQGGPRPGLELYKKVPNLRILACGGDGTAGWILSVLDEIGFYPPIAVLPLGTGNDLARALGWGGGYTDEPVAKILLNVKDGEVVQLDRWDIKVERNSDVGSLEQESSEGAKELLPLNVVNNYFSIGVDAHIALEFHEAREAHPERFNSRLRNKMFYGQAGGKDLLQRKWKDLCNYITLECDGVDLTQRLKDLKVHSLLFLNIPSYGGGTRPWGSNSPSFEIPRTDDGLIEVIGLTTYQLPLLQAGGHGSCIAQCRSAKIITRRTIPMQVDGEPCRLLPSIIYLQFRNRANVIAKSKCHSRIVNIKPFEREVSLEVRKLNLSEYETFHYDKERLRDISVYLGKLSVNPDLELDHIRSLISQMVQKSCETKKRSLENQSPVPDSEVKRYRVEKTFDLSSDWCFVDSCTAERFFRIDRAQEHLHYVVDICNDDLFILDPADESCRDDTSTPNVPPYVVTTPSIERKEEVSLDQRDIFPSFQPQAESSSFTGVAEDLMMKNSDPSIGFKINPSQSSENIIPEEASGKTVSDSESIDSRASDSGKIKLELVTREIIEASKRGDIQTISELHAKGYSLIAIDERGWSALHHASCIGHENVVQYLAATEPDLMDMRENVEGFTPLHIAAKYRQQKVCCILAAAGCSVSKVDYFGMTPKHLARMEGDDELAAYLEHFEQYQNTLRERETTL